MKIIKVFLCLLITISFACNDFSKEVSLKKQKKLSADLVNNPETAQKEKQEGLLPKLSFDKKKHNFGEILQGESVSHLFTFTNSGEGDLIISQAKGSCGCTVPEWPRETISPGETGEIKVTFNSDGKSGRQNKTITLMTNAIPNTTVLTISAHISVPEK